MIEEQNINAPRLKNQPRIIKLGEKSFISIAEYEKRLDSYYDVVFNNNGKEIFLGRFQCEDSIFDVLYNNGKILICKKEFSEIEKQVVITKVYLLYDILDDIFYSVSESKALEIFDTNIDSTYIKTKDKSIIRSDVEKVYRLRRNK